MSGIQKIQIRDSGNLVEWTQPHDNDFKNDNGKSSGWQADLRRLAGHGGAGLMLKHIRDR